MSGADRQRRYRERRRRELEELESDASPRVTELESDASPRVTGDASPRVTPRHSETGPSPSSLVREPTEGRSVRSLREILRSDVTESDAARNGSRNELDARLAALGALLGEVLEETRRTRLEVLELAAYIEELAND